MAPAEPHLNPKRGLSGAQRGREHRRAAVLQLAELSRQLRLGGEHVQRHKLMNCTAAPARMAAPARKSRYASLRTGVSRLLRVSF